MIVAIILVLLITVFTFRSFYKIAANTPVDQTKLSKQNLLLTAEEKKWLDSHQQISVAVRHGYSPIEFIFELHEFRGISVDFLKKLESILNVKFNKITANQDIHSVNEDMISSVAKPEILQNSRFTTLNSPYIISSIGIFAKKGTDIEQIEDLNGLKVAVFKSSKIAKQLTIEHPQIHWYMVDIADEALEAVMTDKVDAYVGNTLIIKYVLKSEGIDDIKWVADTPYRSEVYMAVRNDLPILKRILEKGFSAISDDEKAQTINKWTAPQFISNINYPLIALILLISMSILSVFILWNRRLKIEVNNRIMLEKSLIHSKLMAENAEETIRSYSKDLERLALVAENTTDFVIITDAKGYTIWVNRAFIQATGFTLEDISGKKPGELLQGKETSLESIQQLRHAIDNFSDIKVDLLNYRKNGEQYWVRVKITPTVNSDGEQIFIAVQTDITNQVRYIKTIQDHKEDMNDLFSLSPDGVVAIDSENLITHVNQSFVNMTGLNADMLLGHAVSKLDQLMMGLCVEPDEYKSIDIFAKTEQQLSAAYSRPTSASSFDLPVKLYSLQINSPAFKVLERLCIENNQKRISRVIYFKDVTQKSIIENMKSEFITTAAHELRTPMAVVLGYAELLKFKTFDKEKKIEMIDAIHSRSVMVSSLLDDLLDVAMLEYRSKKTLKLERQSIQTLIESITNTFLFSNNSKPVSLEKLPDIPDFYFDSQRLERAIYNCLTNAYKFSSNSGLVSMRLYIMGTDMSELAIEIKDQGIGMGEEQLSRIFEKFYRADKSGHIPGTGLGMVLVKEIIEAHGGRVIVDSKVNIGTVVTMILPLNT